MSEVKAKMVLEELKLSVMKCDLVGSQVSCYPPPLDSDFDILVLVPSLEDLITAVLARGYAIGGSDVSPNDDDLGPTTAMASVRGAPVSHFKAFRRDDINIIATESTDFYKKFMLATRVATKLNLMKKDDRITLFQAILYGNG